ncbi:hypothetical protein [Aliihoeflea sp. 40Bstr573]|uniref:hypothetical protein n=1 Tax=Aliihoeflea sp. 40Bstr573 TaxID=2696467 RepID=UPI002094E2BF|nr:hypothetical protein [Aliihoeflea sp. 40Bstr573]MCO6387606.1 hypothetical protein [Aliihoeflea sp. 40Bstr573]
MTTRNPIRTKSFRLLTVTVCTLGSFVIGLTAARYGMEGVAGVPAELVGLSDPAPLNGSTLSYGFDHEGGPR